MDRRVFISYSRRDQQVVLPLVDRLRQAGFQPWLDQRSIAVSVPWLDEIDHAIRSSVLFVAIDSLNWTMSDNCQLEIDIARELRKPILVLPASQVNGEKGGARIAGAYRDAEGAEADRARLLGDSARWEAAGRPSGHLPRRGALRAMRTALPTTAGDERSQSFIKAATSAARRRTIVNLVTMLLTLSLWIGWQLAYRLDDAVRDAYAGALGQLATWRATRAALASAPYEGVRKAIESASATPPSYNALWELGTALDTNLPVSIANPDRQAPRAARPLTAGESTRSSGNMAIYQPGKSLIDVTDSTSGHTAVRIDGHLTAMAWSPDGGWIALAEPAGVRIVRVSTGVTTVTLRGLDGAVDSLTWTESSTVVGRSGTISATWRVESSRLVRRTDAWFMGLAANSDRSQMVAVDRNGTYTQIDAHGAYDPIRITRAVTSYTAAWVGDRWVIGSEDRAGNGFLTTVEDNGSIGDSIDLGDCRPTDIAAAEIEHSAFVVCQYDLFFKTVDLRTGRIDTTEVQVPTTSIGTDQQGRVLIGSAFGELQRVENGRDQLIGAWNTMCADGASLLVSSPDGRRLFKGGASARSGCLEVRTNPDDLTTVNRIYPESDGMTNVRAATWSPDGSVLILGFASGEVWFFDVDTAYSRQLSVPTGAEIRGLAFTADGSSLITVTRAGEVIEIPASLPLSSTADRIAEARRRVQIGVDGGLT